MKITTIEIKLEPKEGETIVEEITLIRNANKLWTIRTKDGEIRQGLFFGEIKLVQMIQEVIEKFNAGR